MWQPTSDGSECRGSIPWGKPPLASPGPSPAPAREVQSARWAVCPRKVVAGWMRASAWNSVLFATKSVSQLTSIITPSFAPVQNTPCAVLTVELSGSAPGAVRQAVRTRVNIRLDGALAGRPARLLIDLCQAPGTQRLHCSVDVTLRLHQRLLAVHHPSASLIAQGLDSLRVDLDCCAGQGSTRGQTPLHARAATGVPHPASSSGGSAAPSQPSAWTPPAS